MDKCVTCGRELHPERAKKYSYCMSPECQEEIAKGVTMVAVGGIKAAEQYMFLDENTKDEIASGKYHDQRRGSFGTTASSPPTAGSPAPAVPAQGRKRPSAPAAPKVTRHPWSQRQQRLALLYNEQGLRPDEIAEKIGLSRYLVTQIILNSRTRGKL